MSRPRAGHGLTATWKHGKIQWWIGNADGIWVPSSTAKEWAHCQRCRRPDQYMISAPDGRKVCPICYYYKYLTAEEFWAREDDYLFPYNIGRRSMSAPRPSAVTV